MSTEEPVKLRGGEEHDILAQEQEQAQDRSNELLSSHLVHASCACCGKPTLSTPEKATEASCGPCLSRKVGAGGYVPDGAYSVPVGYPLVIEGWRERTHVCGFDAAEHDRQLAKVKNSGTEPHPAPEIVDGQRVLPGAVLSLAEKAREAGWEVRTSYSLGTAGKKYRGAWQREERIKVSFGLHPLTKRQAVAVYRSIAGRESWAWQSVWMWGPDLTHFGECGITELQQWLEAGGDLGASWYADIKERRAEQAAARKMCKVSCAEDHVHRRAKRKTKEGAS